MPTAVEPGSCRVSRQRQFDLAEGLSEGDYHDLIKPIKQSKPLPEKYRFLLFADQSEGELVWNSKSREVGPATLSLQTLEHITFQLNSAHATHL